MAAGETTLEISSSAITEDSVIDIYVDDEHADVNPTAIAVEDGKVTLTFDAQDDDVNVGVKVLLTDQTKKINELSSDLTDHYYTKTEVDSKFLTIRRGYETQTTDENGYFTITFDSAFEDTNYVGVAIKTNEYSDAKAVTFSYIQITAK